MSNLSELLPAGAGAKSAEFVASGTLGSGVTVVLKADGTVEAVGETIVTNQVGTAVSFNTSGTWLSSAYDSSNNKFVVFYRDQSNSSYGTAVVGTVSGSNISFGGAVIFNSNTVDYTSAAYDSTSEKVVVSFRDLGGANQGRAIVGTVSGTSISFGSITSFTSNIAVTTATTFDSNANRIVIAYRDLSNGQYATAVVGTISGTSISFGSPVVFVSAACDYEAITYDSNSNKVVIAFYDGSNSNYGTAIVGTVSGTSISFGSKTVFNTVLAYYNSIIFDSNSNKIVIAYTSSGTNFGNAIVGTVSGTSISFGSNVVFNAATSTYITATFDSINNKVVIAYRDGGNSDAGTFIVGTVSGTSVSFATPVVFETTDVIAYTANVFDSFAGRAVLSYGTNLISGNTDGAESITFAVSATETNSANFIGITDQAIADTATGAVIVQGGVSDKLSGLTVGADYYVQADGSINSPTALTPFDISGASYDSVSFSVAAQETVPWEIAFNTDGTKMFVVGLAGQDVNEYTLSTGFDVSTSTFVDSFSVAAQETSPTGLAFSTTGTKMFVVGQSGDSVYEYTLSTGFDISTASFVDSFSIAAQETQPTGMAFNTDGTKMFVVGESGDDVNEYTLSTGFDVSTASYSQNFSVAPQDIEPMGITFNANGTKMFVIGRVGQDVNEYALSAGFDVSSASYVQNFSVASQDTTPTGIAFNNDGTKMFIVGYAGDSVYQYSTGVGSATSVPAGRALSSTSILLEG